MFQGERAQVLYSHAATLCKLLFCPVLFSLLAAAADCSRTKSFALLGALISLTRLSWSTRTHKLELMRERRRASGNAVDDRFRPRAARTSDARSGIIFHLANLSHVIFHLLWSHSVAASLSPAVRSRCVWLIFHGLACWAFCHSYTPTQCWVKIAEDWYQIKGKSLQSVGMVCGMSRWTAGGHERTPKR